MTRTNDAASILLCMTAICSNHVEHLSDCCLCTAIGIMVPCGWIIWQLLQLLWQALQLAAL